jgi:hypothetical protein
MRHVCDNRRSAAQFRESSAKTGQEEHTPRTIQTQQSKPISKIDAHNYA